MTPSPGDDGGPAEPLGSIDMLPDSTRLQFLWDDCGLDWESGPDAIGCHRDAHFVGDDGLGSSSLGPGKPFHIRHGFPVVGPDPLGEGFDVAAYVTRSPEDLEDIETAWVPNQTVYFTPDSTVRGQADRCGPQYREQSGPIECQWFVHDFPDGLPLGRYEIAVVWEAPCSAWVQYGLTDACDDPDASQARFSSAVDSPWDAIGTSFDAANHAGLSANDVVELVYGVDADRYSRWTATITGMTEAFNAGRLDDYLASFAEDVTGPGDLVDPDMAAALMAASAAWTHELCLPGDGYGSVDVLTCWTTINDQNADDIPAALQHAGVPRHPGRPATSVGAWLRDSPGPPCFGLVDRRAACQLSTVRSRTRIRPGHPWSCPTRSGAFATVVRHASRRQEHFQISVAQPSGPPSLDRTNRTVNEGG